MGIFIIILASLVTLQHNKSKFPLKLEGSRLSTPRQQISHDPRHIKLECLLKVWFMVQTHGFSWGKFGYCGLVDMSMIQQLISKFIGYECHMHDLGMPLMAMWIFERVERFGPSILSCSLVQLGFITPLKPHALV